MTAPSTATVLPTVADTRAFGHRLAAVLRAGDLVLLSGPLGAGKTALAQGIGAGLGVRGQVTSPTFVIARVHRPDPAAGGTLPMVHVDAYRLVQTGAGPGVGAGGGIGAGTGVDPRTEIDDLDLDASMEDSVTVVEWGDGAVERLADAHLRVRIERRDDDTRVVTLEPHGGDWADRVG